jgi:predicted permease
VGVTPPEFVGAWSDAEGDVWMPLTMQQALGYQSNASSYGSADLTRPWFQQNNLAWLNLFGRLAPERRARATATLEAANRDALTDLALTVPAPQRRSITSGRLVVEPFVQGFSGLRSRFASALVALAGMVVIVLLVACANIANLLLARSTARAREIGIRIALGASRARLVQQGLIESLLLASIGGASGLLFGSWTSRALANYTLGQTNNPLPRVFDVDSRVVVFTAATSLGTALLFGMLPSLRATKFDVIARLSGGRGVVSRSMIGGMRPLVTAQLALSFVVVFAAALLGRSLLNFSHVDPGFSRDRTVAVSFNPRLSGFSIEQLPAVRDRLVNAATSVPGVTSAAISTCGLLANCSQSSGFTINERSGIQLNENYVGADYFTTVGVPVKGGREFTGRDVENAPRVAVVSESVARRYYGGVITAIGQRIGDDETTAEIVGVVGDTRPLSLRDAPVPMVYFPIAQNNQPVYTLAARVTGDAQTAALAIGKALRAAEPGLVIDTSGTMSTYVTLATSRERLVTYLVSALGALSLLLACVGLYGVLSYTVVRRLPELGVRAALGATPAGLRNLVLRDAVQIVAWGTFVGLGVAWWANRLIRSQLFDVGVFDPLACAIVIAVLGTSAIAACLLPAARASRIDPLHALRQE